MISRNLSHFWRRQYSPLASFTSTSLSSALQTSPHIQLVMNSPTDSASFLQNVKAYFDEAATYSNIRHDLLNVMREGRAAIKVMLTLVRDNGTVKQNSF